MEPLPAAFYGEIDGKNPVIATFETELSQFLGYLRKTGKGSHQDYRQGSNTLFHIWVKYKPRLPTWYYQEKLLNVGDSLVVMKEYKLALFQCFGRYIEQFCSADINDITDVNQFKSTFFPNGTDDKNASLTFHALQGRCICLFQQVKTNLQNPESVKQCVNILSFLQLIMQVILPHEHLCWLIFNGSIHIYTICRHLMALGHSSKVLDYLLWVSVCLESSVPLLSLHYLTWRATLYTAVCQCYYDCEAGVHGEVFARRALSKINELRQLENISNSSDAEETKKIFAEATCKMAVMIFKRAVFESRRKPKGMLRPKQRNSLKDVEKLPWPRTNTEKLLVEMFDNGPVQLLAIIEALSNSNRRVFQAGPPVPDEPEIHDVIAELFFAGIDIISGGGNKAERGSRGHSQSEMWKLLEQSSLMDLAVEGKDSISAEAVVKFAKLAFSYEQWDIFDAVITPIYTFLQNQDATRWKKEEMNLKVLIAAEPLLSGKKHKHGFHNQEKINRNISIHSSLGIVDFEGDCQQDRPQDDQVLLAETVFACYCSSLQDILPDREIVTDVILFLWQKCKFVLQRLQAADGPKFIHKCEANSKWIYILCCIYEVMHHCNIMDNDAEIMAEAALKLAGISEGMADSVLKYSKKPEKSLEKINDDSVTPISYSTKSIHLKKNPVIQLNFAYETVDKAIKEMCLACSRTSVQNGKSVIDHYCAMRQHLKNTAVEQNSSSKSHVNKGMVMDLQIELIVTQHRVSVKLLNLLQGLVLRSWKEYELALLIIEAGKKILDISENTSYFNQLSPSKLTFFEAEKVKDTGDKEKKNDLSLSDKVSEHLSTLELHLLKLTKPSNGTDLTGQEDPVLLHAVVTCWPTVTAYKEVLKFKKKSRFLEFFVQLLQRVVNEEKFQRALEWATAVLDYLKRRNENLLGIRKTEVADDPMPTGSYKRYTAAIVKYHKDEEQPMLKKDRKQIKTEKSMTLPLGEAPDKKAFVTLKKRLLPIAWRYIKNKKLRKISTEEMPWRSQLNIFLAYTHFSMFRHSVDKLYINDSGWTQNTTRVLDPELFTLHHAGTVVMETETTSQDKRIASPGHLHPSLKLDLPSGIKLTGSNDFSEPSTNRSDPDTPRTQMTNDTEHSSRTIKEQVQPNMSSVILLDHLEKTYVHLKRAAVLAYRGGHWTLLQNTCRVIWNLTLELQLLTKQFEVTNGTFPLSRGVLNNELWLPFYLAADLILDMVVILQETGAVKIVDSNEKFSVPSCIGGVSYEEGGSNLAFEYPLDDINIIDIRWMCDLVLKAIELSFHVQKWESLVHLAIQFNIITHERYSEQVTPLLVHAQRMLNARMCEINSSITDEPSLIKYMFDQDEKINCRNYIGRQSPVGLKYRNIKNSEGKVNWKAQTALSDGKEIKAFAGVPLDVMDTLACFRETLQKSKYSSRALKHSRKLLALFLAHEKGLNARERMPSPCLPSGFGKVGFSDGALQAHQPVPPDLSEEQFHSLYSIESKPLPPAHILVVISSYNKTVEILHSHNQQGLKAQALHELGNLHLYAGNKRAAFKCWCQALDETLNMSDALNSWPELDSSPDSVRNGKCKDYSEKFLSRAGIWGCLQAAIITAKMYILTSSLNKRTECCILSALLFKALFQASLPHPTNNYEYASYEIGEGCEIPELIPGIDLFSDRYRANVATVIGSLSFVMCELHAASQNLMVLPLFTLYQYFVSMIGRDPVKSVEGRLLKINALVDLHLFTEAFHELSLLNHGKRIPSRTIQGLKFNGKTLNAPKFSSSMTIISRENLEVIEEVFNRQPSPYLQSVCDQSTMNKFILAKMKLILKLSSTINAISEAEGESCDVTEQGNNSKDSNDSVRFTLKKDITLSELKCALLNEAEKKLKDILHNLQEKYGWQLLQCSAMDLAVVIEAKLQLSEIAQQRHQTASSVALAFSTLLLLQNANIFTTNPPKHRKDKTSANECLNLPCETEAEQQLTIRTWLCCRLYLVCTLATQLRGIGIEGMSKEEFLDCSTIITQGIVEAESLGDTETQAFLMLQAAFHHIKEGHSTKGVQNILENIITLFEGKHFMSPAVCLTFAQSLILSADLIEMENERDQHLFWTKQIHFLTLAQTVIINQLESLGEVIENLDKNPMNLSPVQTLRNIYLPHINLLSKIKMRIDLSLLPSYNLHTTALKLCRISSFRAYDLEAEILFQKGMVEQKMSDMGDLEKSSSIKSFSEAISVSQNYDQNFSLIRKSYLEIALLYLHMITLDTKNLCMSLESEKASSNGQVDKRTEEKSTEKHLNASELYRFQIWTAIRAATQLGNAMLSCKQLIGMHSVSAQDLTGDLQSQVPVFVCMDLLTTYKKYLSDEKNPGGIGDATDDFPKEKLSWVHLIRYYNHLQRLLSMINTNGFTIPMEGNPSAGYIWLTSHFKYEVVARFLEMHQFLKKNLDSYATCCVNCSPGELFIGLEKPLTGSFEPLKKTEEEQKTQSKIPSSWEVPTNVFVRNNENVSSKGRENDSIEEELCVQWYCPSLERQEQKKSMVLLLYACKKKRSKIEDSTMIQPTNHLCGYIWLPLSSVIGIHEKLCTLKQKAEMVLQPEKDISLNDFREKAKYSAKSKTNLKTVCVPEEIQEIVKQICFEIHQLLRPVEDSKPFSQAPFDITLPSLIRLEKMFDLTHGSMLTKGCLLDWIVSQLT
ncbi:hypothetical protein GDO86_005631 [Hymenochirus boettgeri]|uniref:Cilia- and flagella-associated protein 54 n=1 Tax=Hymenochirus boettgeri TaxID=247094 RepID=A0A8T2J2P3_9PIPI|nr:hypothetical protein GDO86_005631 [Hymenochirus boettgeri]